MKAVFQLTLFSIGLIAILTTGFDALLSIVGHEHVFLNIILAPFVSAALTVSYCSLVNYVERIHIRHLKDKMEASNQIGIQALRARNIKVT